MIALLFTVDRIEGSVAVLCDEKGEMYDLPICNLPFSPREGDRLTARLCDNAICDVKMVSRAESLKSESAALFEKLKNRSDKL